MSVTEGNDFDQARLGKYLVGVYYYALGLDEVMSDDSAVIGFCDTIQTVTFNPFIDFEELDLIKCNFDSDKYGAIGHGIVPNCYRISSVYLNDKKLGELDMNVKKKYVYSEPKLDYYPYKYYLVTDYINPPLLIKPQLVNGDKIEVYVKRVVGETGLYNIYCRNYNKDYYGNLEGNISVNPLLFPVSSSAYSQFMSTSYASFKQSILTDHLINDVAKDQAQHLTDNAYNHLGMKTALNTVSGAVGGGVNGASMVQRAGGGTGAMAAGAAIGAVVGGGSALLNAKLENENLRVDELNSHQSWRVNRYNIEATNFAKVSDLMNTPKALKNTGNEAIFNLENSRHKVDIIEYGLKDEQYQRLQTYFNRYGYRVDQYGGFDITSRKYFNFIKTSYIDFSSDVMSKGEMEQLEAIFNSGVTFWHVENGAEIGEYRVNNSEVLVK